MTADPTPTTVGIIQGDVRLDADQFHEEIARVRAAVAALREDDPHVRVEADTGDALARLAEVEAASEAVGGGRRIEVDASGTRISTAAVDRAEAQAAMDLARARVLAAMATDRLNAADAEHGAEGFIGDTLRPTGMGAGPEYGLMAHETRGVTESTEEAARALKHEQVVLDGLEAAAKHTRIATDDLAASERRAASAGSGGGRGGYMAIILGIIAALIPMMGPLGGYLIGLTGGFTAMGAAGVLAVLGIQRQMAAGTAEGQAYRAGLETLQGVLHSLEDQAAKATLPGFTQTVALLQAALPDLNGETRVFGTLLGNTVASGAKTVLDVIQALSPALQAGAVGFQDFIHGLDGWATGTDGAHAFGDYIVRMMPQVGEVLNHIITTVGLLLTELSPLGSVMLGIINVAMGLVNVAEGLGPAFAPAVAGALALWGAMKGWGMLAPLLTSISAALGPVTAETALYVDLLASEPGVLAAVTTGEAEAAAGATALGGAIDFAAGPVGWIVGLLGALGGALLVAANASGQAEQSAADYTAAVQQDNGVVGENTRLLAAQTLQKEGAAAAGAKLGLSLKTLTDASLGNAAAQKRIADATKAAEAENAKIASTHLHGNLMLEGLNRTTQQAATLVNLQATSVKSAIKAYNDLQGALGGTKISTAAQLREQTALANKYGEDLPTFLAAAAAQKQQKVQADAATAAMVQENDAAGLLKGALDLLNGKTLGVAQAQTGAAAATNSLIDSLKQNGTVVDGNSKKAVANQQAIQSVVTANQQVAEAVATASKSSKAGVASYEASKTAMEKNLAQAGLLTKGMKAYIDKLYDLKNLHVPPTKLDADNSAALAAIAAVKSGLQNLQGTSADVYVNAIGAGIDPGRAAQIARNAGLAYGGTTLGHAATGVTAGDGTVRGPGSALSDTAGLWALANGEEVISNRNGQADAWRPLLKAINRGDFRGVRLGGGGERQSPHTIKTVNMGGIHLHSPVAQDPVAAAEDASQMIVAYAGFPL